MIPAPERIVLVGLSGAGKSTVGPLVCAQLDAAGHHDWGFVDLDAEVEAKAGRRIPEIFARQGEAAFRKLERSVSREVAGSGRIVVATGGGWIELRDAVEEMLHRSISVYLRISPEVAAARISAQGGGRPLVGGQNPVGKLVELLARREALYLQASHTVSVDSMSPDEVAANIVALATG
ncbi:MAG TPA: shikimate kinase [Gemmatimonadaceae bacterium]|nr:shikimate kinase [Gemmatimonadaceae bacterium]HRQ77704.1 shikimate kinase [Gemmatimonadaceae bacterium]